MKHISIMVRHRVNDYNAWKTEFDNFSEFRKSQGELSYQILQPIDDTNNLRLIFEWDDVTRAKKFLESPELRMTMEKAGVTEKPEITFVTEADKGIP